jgi:acetyl esterase/lipase
MIAIAPGSRSSHSIRKRRYPLAISAAGLVILCGLFLAPFVKAHLQAATVLDLVAGKPVPGLLSRLTTEPVATRELDLPSGTGAPIHARLYTPVHHPNAPALIVFHGVHHLGMNEPRLMSFASAMASCGLRVLTPELPDIKDYHIGPGSITAIGDSATWLSHQNMSSSPVGIMGLSFAGGLSLLAAGNPAYQPSIGFVVAIGSQDDMSRVARYYRTGGDLRPDGTEEQLPPHEYGALVLEYEHLEDFVPKADIPAVRAVLRAHLYEEPASEKAAFLLLTPQQLSEAHQLMDTTSSVTRAALTRSEVKHLSDMDAVSPHGKLSGLTTPVYLLHGEGDNIIPAAETLWMQKELPSKALQATLISPVLSHLDLDGASPTLADHLRLVHFFALILQAAGSH